MSNADLMRGLGFETRTNQQIIDECVEAMKALGAVRLEGEYSGGNDEGGIEIMRLFGPNDVEIECPPHSTQVPDERSPSGFRFEYDESGIWAKADKVIGLEFGSWAGEFNAWGTLIVNADDRTARYDGSYETPSESDYSGSL